MGGLFLVGNRGGRTERGRSGGVGQLGELGPVAGLYAASSFYRRGGQRRDHARKGGKDDGVGCDSSASTCTSGELVAEAMAALKRARRGGLGRREGCSEVGARRWAARHGAGGSARSHRGACVSCVHAASASEDSRRGQSQGRGRSSSSSSRAS